MAGQNGAVAARAAETLATVLSATFGGWVDALADRPAVAWVGR